MITISSSTTASTWSASPPVDAGPGSIFADPLFGDLADLRPRPTSPVVDGGADDALPLAVTTDLAGDPRRIGTVDIGAYEVPEPSAALAAAAALLALAVRSRSAA